MNGKPARRDSGNWAGASGENTGFGAYTHKHPCEKTFNHSAIREVNHW
jgi:hypothetical protein